MNTRLLNLGTCTCAMAAPRDVLVAMDHYVYGCKPTGGPIDFRISLDCHPRTVESLRKSLESIQPLGARRSHPEQQYHAWNDDGREVLLPLAEKDHVIWRQGSYINVTAETSPIAATVGTRIVRQLIMRGGEARGGQCVHAGAVELGGTAVLVGGHAGAGKTTVLTHLIEHHGAQLLSNDRTVVMPRDGGWAAIGVPLAWRYTPEGLRGSPALATAVGSMALARGGELVDGKIELTPLEVSRVLNRPARTSAPISRIIVLSRSPQRPDTDAALKQLGFGDADFFAEDWLNVRGEFAASSHGGDLWAALQASVPICAFSWTDPTELQGVADSIASGGAG